MFNKVNDKDKEYNSNNAMRPLFIAIFMVSLALLSIFYVWVSGGFGISYKGLKPASERWKRKPSNITSNIPITSNIIESNSNSNEVIEPTSNETSNRQVEPTSNSNNNIVEPTSNSNSNKVEPAPPEPLNTETSYKILHKYEAIDGIYTIFEENRKGIIDSEVTPDIKPKTGYKNPEVKTVKIDSSGETIIEYYYSLEKYTLTVNDYDYIEEGNVSGEYKYGSKVTLTAKNRYGYNFSKWSNNDTTSQITLTITGDTEIGPLYVIDGYKVDFIPYGGTVDPNSKIVIKGEQIGEMPTPSSIIISSKYFDYDRTFLGWYSEINNGTKIEEDYVPQSDMKVYANYDDPCKGFAVDSWENIKANVDRQLDYYPIGCAREIELNFDDDVTYAAKKAVLRVSNNTYPEECDTDSFSQTACGFVLEFEEETASYLFNSNKNDSSYYSSDVRKFLNREVYEALPDDLQNIIINTYITSSKSLSYSNVIIKTSNDKIYLLSAAEINPTHNNAHVNIDATTRRLDFYNNFDSNVYQFPYASKSRNSDGKPIFWWTRDDFNGSIHYLITTSGVGDYQDITTANGLAPAFRISSPGSNYYTVTYNSNGGHDIESVTLKAGNSVGTLPTPASDRAVVLSHHMPTDDYFIGWYTEINGGIKVEDGFIPESDITLYARYNDPCKGFALDSWENIAQNVENQMDYYGIGCAKIIDIDFNHDGVSDKEAKIYVANNTMPEECNDENFSQTACGFVLDFETVITHSSFTNVSVSSYTFPTETVDQYGGDYGVYPNGNTGGWKASYMRDYLNTFILSSLPDDLKKIIVPTKVLSNTENISEINETNDKLYYFSTKEVTNQPLSTDIEQTRQTDFFSYFNISERYYKEETKYYTLDYSVYGSNSSWALRTAVRKPSSVPDYYLAYAPEHATYYKYASETFGIAPVFKISTQPLSENYYVKYDANGGFVEVDFDSIKKGTGISKLKTPVAPLNKSFVGWYTDLTGGIKVEDGFIPTNDITLYARYIDNCELFESDDWSTIVTNLNNKYNYYGVGCTKTIEMDLDDDGINESYKVRLSNNTTHESCSLDEFSQTACGFVIEFENAIFNHRMNPTDSNVGGWKGSELRNYLNTDFYNKLPSDLKQVIIPTKVLSGSGPTSEGTIYTTSDNIYLASPIEVFNNSFGMIPTKRFSRRLDFYITLSSLGIPREDYFNAKIYSREPYPSNASDFRTIESELVTEYDPSVGRYVTAYRFGVTSEKASVETAVAPVFRIGLNDYYVIHYNSNGGTKVNDDIITVGNSIDRLPTVSFTGQNFIGWYTDINGGIKVEDGYIPQGNITLYARYEDLCNGFSTDSWDTIAANVKNNLNYYPLGCTKSVTVDIDNDGRVDTEETVRIVNNSNSTSCKKSSYSKSACGFVLEFENALIKRRMNDTDKNLNGWSQSEMRNYLNNILINGLPSELQMYIIPTTVISSYKERNKDAIMFNTVDKLYLLSTVELTGTVQNEEVNLTHTRQLDLYNNTDISRTKKLNDGTVIPWRLRSVPNDNSDSFYSVYEDETISQSSASVASGISPVFRINGDKYYVIRYETTDESTVANTYVKEGEEIGTLPIPKLTNGKRFLGWYTEINGGVKVESDYIPEGNITLYARTEETCNLFEEDSWDTIAANVSEDPGYYGLGCEKTVDINYNNTEYNLTVKVVNNSVPEECNNENYSESACGFVVEFMNGMVYKKFNSFDDNSASWRGSEIREYINTDYFDLLPEDLRNNIIPTKVITGAGKNSLEKNTITYDRLYFLSVVELVGENINYYDSLTTDFTRQLDYYNLKEVSQSNLVEIRKQDYRYPTEIIPWWLRAPVSNSTDDFYYGYSGITYESSSEQNLVTPVFRIGSSNKIIVNFSNVSDGQISPMLLSPGESIDNLPVPTAGLYSKFVGWYTELEGGEKVENGFIPTGDTIIYARYEDTCDLFENDSWDTIVANVRENTEYYGVGCTKQVSLDLDNNGTYETETTVRVANNTLPASCGNLEYSQTACGFILEFENIIGNSKYYSSSSGANGYDKSIVRNYLNTNIYNALPSEIKNNIIEVATLSGSTSSSYYKTLDKLYLLSSTEVQGSPYSADYLSTNYTRQLDYYRLNHVSAGSYSLLKKNDLNGNSVEWWLRGSNSTTSYIYESSRSYTNMSTGSYSNSYGVLPAFRLAPLNLTITLNANGGILSKTEYTVNAGVGIKGLPIPEAPEAKRFTGWYTDLTGGYKITEDYIPNGNVTLYARYENACVEFENDSWDTIVANVDRQVDYYQIGCTKNISLDMNNDGVGETAAVIRIANNSDPVECGKEGFSQSACGFVLEFTTVPIKKKYNSTATNVGSWKNSEIRNYINMDLYNTLPIDLKNVIVPTKIITGHGDNSGEVNTETTDMLYLFSTLEINSSFSTDTLTSSETRKLDYYKLSYASKAKKYNSSNSTWALRSPYKYNTTSFFYVDTNSSVYNSGTSNSEYGVAPAFKIGLRTNYYKILFNINGTQSVDFYEADQEIQNLPEPKIPQKRFDGWYTGLTDGIKIEEGFIPTSDMTLYARFTDICTEFNNDSWDTIVSNVKNQTDYYPVGCTKEVTLNTGSGTVTNTLRVANNTTPEKCNSDNFSQTACGFVLEFMDNIEYKKMNSVETNVGGWKSSEARGFVNSDVYNSLPEVLKNNIIPTKVISGHGSTAGEENFVSNDYLYLLSSVEVHGTRNYDTVSTDETRQLDYYSDNGITANNASGASKNYTYFLRSAYSTSTTNFSAIYSQGTTSNYSANTLYAIIPAFRIGTNDDTYYTVNYDTMGGQGPALDIIKAGNAISTLPVATAPFKEFVGWYTDATNGEKVEDGYIPDSNVTLYARYIDLCENFKTDSWDTIATNVESNPNYYLLGCTRDIPINNGTSESTATIRILNTSTPEECNGENYSETACGFVLGFEDYVDVRKMNNSSTNVGGWPASSLRSWVNYDFKIMLPSDLRNNIIPTKVISGHGSTSGETNFISKDNLYLLSTVEIWGSTYNDTLSTSQTRQMDYYKQKNINYSYYSLLAKSKESFLRSAYSSSNYYFNTIRANGYRDYESASSAYGIIPVFRVGKIDKTYYTIAYETYDGTSVPIDIIEAGTSIETLPSTSHSTKTFDGWYTAKRNGTKVSDGFTPTKDTLLYARFVDECTEFEEDSWDEIKANVDTRTNYYPLGCTKEVELDFDNDGATDEVKKVRITNNTTPTACNRDNYSQTACGFVLEFTDIITKYKMHDTSINKGGWPETDVRTYLSNDLYNALPSDLKSVIMSTYTLSGNGMNDSGYFETIDKLYLLSSYEVHGDKYYDELSSTYTRQLDYYKSKNVTSYSYSAAKKEYNGNSYEWWLRGAKYNDSMQFTAVSSSGGQSYEYADSNYAGVSPAFRVGTPTRTYYTVKFNTNGGKKIKDMLVKDGDSVDLPDIEVSMGTLFDGWYTDLNGGIKVEDGFIPTGDITLYARFIDLCNGFADASWDTIAANVSNNTEYYGIGCTKTIDLDFDQDGEADKTMTLRVANNTTPTVCDGDNYSQTACGFVLEFNDIISLHKMNDTYTNAGGWPESNGRTYLSNDIYNALPSELKSVIINTYAISGYGSNDTENFVSIDKLYLLSTIETHGSTYYDTVSTTYTRQLDYYNELEVTSNEYSALVKKYENSSYTWWLRSAESSSESSFDSIGSSGYQTYDSASSSYIGISPAFRIGSSDITYYTITYNTNGASEIKDMFVKSGRSIETLPTLNAPLGKGFDGWYTQLEGGTKVEDGYTPTGDITLYARYIDLCDGFENESWDTIYENINNQMDYYGVGCSKPVDLDFDQDGVVDKTTRVRIANNTVPEECSDDNYSQTACGLVLEFEEVIATNSMGETGAGGWPATSLRQYINGDIYNALPSDLKNIIKPTKVISGYTSPDSSNFVSIDNLYPLNLVEVFNYEFPQADTVTFNETRQLDIYNILEVSVENQNFNGAIKKFESDNSSYWLRTPYSGIGYLNVSENGGLDIAEASSISGVAPAFRIGESTENYIVIKFNSNGGSNIGDSYYVEGNAISSLPTPIPPEGYGFDGWYTQLEGGEKVESGYIPNGNVTLYARYIDICNGFDSTDWSTISANVNEKLDYYGIGCRKNVELDFNQDGTIDKTVKVRVANNTEPEECNGEGFSQSACGFVLEFDEIIEYSEMNDSSTISGGYPESTLKTLIDSTVYNSLPADLKELIIDTPSIYSNGESGYTNVVNKLYLLTFNELFEDQYGVDSITTDYTRQLDYYNLKGLSTASEGSWTVPKKKFEGSLSEWWLSTVYSSYYLTIPDDNPISYTSPTSSSGISPAFRLAGTKRSFD